MPGESLRIAPFEQNVDYYILTLFDRLESMRKESNGETQRHLYKYQTKRKMQMEVRTLEFWRSVISECLGSFLYVFIVCGAAAGAGVGASVSSVLLATALASGLAMATLTQCFMQTSGAHINPAVTLASCVIRSISPFRAAMYITAQCGGSIAGAALLYGVTVPGYQGNLQTTISHSASLPAWERFGVEFILTFVVVLSYFISTDSIKTIMGNSTTAIGFAYGACSFVSMPFLNPARSLGPSFVLNKWDNHWVYWFGPLVGGVTSGIVYEYVFNSKRNLKSVKASSNNESSSLQSAADLNYNTDLEKSNVTAKYPGIFQRTEQSTNSHNVDDSRNVCKNLYSAQPVTKYDQTEPLYSGTRSMYCRSPTLPRNLNRSQSVYAKSNSAINREVFDRSGPLVPAQSLCPMRNRNQQAQNQNLQNQLQQRTETVYGIQEPPRQNQPQQHQNQQPLQHNMQQQDPQQRPHPQESLYGPPMIGGRGQSAQSDDSSYGSYHGSAMTPVARNNNGASSIMIYGPLPSHSGDNHHGSYIRTQSERKISPPIVSSHSESAAAMPPTFPANQRPPLSERHQQQQMYMHHQQYEMLPVRHK